MSAPPVLLVYGNCQAEAIASTLAHSAAVEFFDVVYLRSFEHPVLGRAVLDDELLRRCTLLWEQRDYEPFPYAAALANVPRAIFPAVDLNVLWPFTCENPFNRPEPPLFPFGRFHYGDRNVVVALKEGLDADAALERVLRAWEAPIALDRLLDIDRARLRDRDLHCDVRMADHVIERFRHEACFFTRDHPTLALLFTLIERLIERTCAYEPRLTAIRLDERLRSHFSSEPLGDVRVPIHPRVAEHFGLSWYQTEDMRAYYQAMIEHGIAQRDAACTP